MTAATDLLRSAASAMRDDWPETADPAVKEGRLRRTYLALADWLDASADHADSTGGRCVCDDAASAVAAAYLGRTA